MRAYDDLEEFARFVAPIAGVLQLEGTKRTPLSGGWSSLLASPEMFHYILHGAHADWSRSAMDLSSISGCGAVAPGTETTWAVLDFCRALADPSHGGFAPTLLTMGSHAAPGPAPPLAVTLATHQVDDKARIIALEERVRNLEEQLARLLAMHAPPHDDVVPPSPHARWIASNLDELRMYPDTWVVLDPEKGIIFHTKDEDELNAQLVRYPLADRDRLVPFNTRLYI